MTNQYHLLEGLSDGFITPEKLKRAALSVEIQLDDEEIKRIITSVNEDREFDNIAYYEFMTAVCKHQKAFSRERLWGIFK